MVTGLNRGLLHAKLDTAQGTFCLAPKRPSLLRGCKEENEALCSLLLSLLPPLKETQHLKLPSPGGWSLAPTKA